MDHVAYFAGGQSFSADLIERLPVDPPDAPFFRGINETWRPLQDAFATPGWLEHSRAVARRAVPSPLLKAAYRRLFRGGDVPNYLAMPLRLTRRKLAQRCTARILDFGGGFGENYALIRRELGGAVKWSIVDNRCAANLSNELYGGRFPDLHFAEEIGGTHDLALLIGSLQYVKDWRNLLAKIAAHGLPDIYIARTPIRIDGPSFLTTQDICPPLGRWGGRKVGEANVWVLGRNDMARTMAALGYRLAEERFNQSRSHDYAHLPTSHRNVAYLFSHWVPVHADSPCA